GLSDAGVKLDDAAAIDPTNSGIGRLRSRIDDVRRKLDTASDRSKILEEVQRHIAAAKAGLDNHGEIDGIRGELNRGDETLRPLELRNPADPEVSRLRQELRSTRKRLQDTIAGDHGQPPLREVRKAFEKAKMEPLEELQGNDRRLVGLRQALQMLAGVPQADDLPLKREIEQEALLTQVWNALLLWKEAAEKLDPIGTVAIRKD